MQFVCETYNEDFSARKRRKSGNSLYVEYMGNKNMSLFSFCLWNFKQLVFSNIPFSFPLKLNIHL